MCCMTMSISLVYVSLFKRIGFGFVRGYLEFCHRTNFEFLNLMFDSDHMDGDVTWSLCAAGLRNCDMEEEKLLKLETMKIEYEMKYSTQKF